MTADEYLASVLRGVEELRRAVALRPESKGLQAMLLSEERLLRNVLAEREAESAAAQRAAS
jgi:hypothetical protein